MLGKTRPQETCSARGVQSDAVLATKSVLARDETYQSAGALFAALADPTRLRIMHALLERELCTCEIAAALGASDSNISQHLRILRSLQLVRPRRDGKFVYYRLDDGHVGTLLRMALTHLEHVPNATANHNDRRSNLLAKKTYGQCVFRGSEARAAWSDKECSGDDTPSFEVRTLPSDLPGR